MVTIITTGGLPHLSMLLPGDARPSTSPDLPVFLGLVLVPGPELVLLPQQALFHPFVLSYLPRSNLLQPLSLPLTRQSPNVTRRISSAIERLIRCPLGMASVLWVCHTLCSPTPCQLSLPTALERGPCNWFSPVDWPSQ